jgi:CRISPR/Cas system CMR subunit Cmr4 (Cas7 group RAMP superfamily)
MSEQNVERKSYQHRYIARVVIEAETPIKVGSGNSSMLSDSLVIRDVNGLPYIPGSAITGVIRHAISQDKQGDVFGYSSTSEDEDNGIGSRFICTSAHLVAWDKHKTVLEGIVDEKNVSGDIKNFMKAFRTLPIRQHVRINEKGVVADTGKFDEEVVYKGSRFCFEMELFGETKEEVQFFKDEILPKLLHVSFRLGGGTRKGFGAIHIISYQGCQLNLANETDLAAYLSKSSSLNIPNNSNFKWNEQETMDISIKGWTSYALSLKPDNFFIFGSGLSNDKADMTSVKENIVNYEAKYLMSNQVLIPGSSVKGALAHRVAFYYNLITNGNKVGKENEAVRTLFGCEKKGNQESSRGQVLISDVFRNLNTSTVFNHVCIDRFTGGAMEGFLFNEEVTYGGNQNFTLNISVENNALKDVNVKSALEAALHDLCNGLLPLGGSINRGHGCFTGTLTKKEEQDGNNN